jgi:hypothetical protein
MQMVSGCVCAPLEPKVAYPAPLEAVLRAEEALDTHFKACGALEGASVVGAVYAYALALFGSLVSHHG